jgi:putative transposase
MPYDPEVHHRRSIRLKGYDYRQNGAYFVTVCTHERQCLLGQVTSGGMQISAVGESVTATWQALPERFREVRLDAFVVMPNHVHGIVWINEGAASGAPTSTRATDADYRGAASSAPTSTHVAGAESSTPGLGEIMRAFKSLSAIAANRILGRSGTPFWQRNYYEHVIRNDHDLDEIRRYIVGNPSNWEEDENNPHGS